MESNNTPYSFEKSLERIDALIIENTYNFEEVNEIPPRRKLSHDNGYYVNCIAIFVDIRKSSKLTDAHYRPTLAKLYRAYISEVTAILNSNPFCKEINIVGDSISGICNSNSSDSADRIVDTAGKICSLVRILNYKFKKSNIQEIDIGIGISYGRALMIQAGNKDSRLNEVVWMGDVVNEASNLCNMANKESDYQVLVSYKFLDRLSDNYQDLFSENAPFFYVNDEMSADLTDEEMEEWYQDNCSKGWRSFFF